MFAGEDSYADEWNQRELQARLCARREPPNGTFGGPW